VNKDKDAAAACRYDPTHLHQYDFEPPKRSDIPGIDLTRGPSLAKKMQLGEDKKPFAKQSGTRGKPSPRHH
jgi:hypothetical protein